MSERSGELVRDLVAPGVVLVVGALGLWAIGSLPVVCNGTQDCSAGSRESAVFASAVALVLAFVLAVIVRARNASGMRTRAETVTFVVLIVVTVLGMLVSLFAGGFWFPLLISLAHST